MKTILSRAGRITAPFLILAAFLAGMASTPAKLRAAAAAYTAVGAATATDYATAFAADVDVAGGSGLDITDNDVPLAGWSLMWIDSIEDTESIIYYDKGDSTVFVPLSYQIGDRTYFFGYPFNSYHIKPNHKEFSDITGHWAADNIIFVAGREASLGFPDGRFDPNAQMTRAMLATVLARMIIADLSDFNYRMFDDVDPYAWYGPSVAWAYEYGVVEGIGGGKFDPNGNVTRQDMCLMIERFLDAFGIELMASGKDGIENDDAFFDEDRIGFWAADAVAHMVEHGILQGRPGNQLDPRGFSTRAEVATVLFRLVESAVTEAFNRL